MARCAAAHDRARAPPTAANALPLRPRQFPLDLFGQLVERALDRGGRSAPEDEVFVDVGSGCGRLVLGTALLWPEMSRVAGVETQEDLHKLAVAADAKAREADGLRCDFVLGDAREAMGEGGPLEDASIIFAYHSPKDCCTWFAEFCATCLRPGCRVIYCDKLLEGEGLELIDRIEGVNPETGGNSTGLIYEVTRSARSG